MSLIFKDGQDLSQVQEGLLVYYLKFNNDLLYAKATNPSLLCLIGLGNLKQPKWYIVMVTPPVNNKPLAKNRSKSGPAMAASFSPPDGE